VHTDISARRRRAAALSALAIVAAVAPASAGNAADARVTTRVSIASQGTEADRNSLNPSISSDGRVIAFSSNATNLVPGDSNGLHDIFLHDMQARSTVLVSVGVDGTPADGASSSPRVSDNGRFVTYYSDASNLVADDANGATDVFVYDRQTRTNIRVPGGDAGGIFPDINSTGRYIAYSTDASLVPQDSNRFMDVYVYDRTTGQVSLISRRPDGTAPVGTSFEPAISGNGRYVAYKSSASDVVEQDNPDDYDIFLYDRTENTTVLASAASDGTPASGPASAASLSGNGRFIAFVSSAGNLVPGDTNDDADVFLRDRVTGRTTVVSATPEGVPGNGFSTRPDVSPDGRYVGFWSTGTNLTGAEIEFDVHTYLHDRQTRRNTLVSVPAGGTGSGGGWSAAVSDGGRFVAYDSFGTDLVPGDTNNEGDVFVTQLY
jgi:Tol biopolymer transport system component